ERLRHVPAARPGLPTGRLGRPRPVQDPGHAVPELPGAGRLPPELRAAGRRDGATAARGAPGRRPGRAGLIPRRRPAIAVCLSRITVLSTRRPPPWLVASGVGDSPAVSALRMESRPLSPVSGMP